VFGQFKQRSPLNSPRLPRHQAFFGPQGMHPPTSSPASTSDRGAREWEELRKEARKLESEVDVKLASFSKLGQGIGEVYGIGQDGEQVRSPDCSLPDYRHRSTHPGLPAACPCGFRRASRLACTARRAGLLAYQPPCG
jgi:hypothetical protein